MNKSFCLKIILFFSLSFLIKINVFAEEYLYCEYTDDTYMVIIKYENKQITIEKGAKKSFAYTTFTTSFPNQISEIRIRNSKYELKCPDLYYDVDITSGTRSVTYLYNIYFTDDNKKNSDSKIFPLVKEDIQNDPNLGNEEEYNKNVLSTCVYYNNQNTKIFSMTILTDHTTTNEALFGSFYQNYSLNNSITNVSTCPEFVYLTCSSRNGNFCSVGFDSVYSSLKLTLNGEEANSDGQINNLLANYILVGNSNEIIKISKDSVDGYKAYVGNKKINISNYDSYKNIFENRDLKNYPAYIIYSGSSYSFSDKSSNDANSKSYILKNKLLGLPDNILKDTIEKECSSILGFSFINFLRENVFNLIYIAVPILLIILTSFDFAKVIFNNDKEALKKAGNRFGKRVIVAILILIVPSILSLLLKIIGLDELQKCIDDLNGEINTSS